MGILALLKLQLIIAGEPFGIREMKGFGGLNDGDGAS
jgi:hypothetical protein